MCLCCLLSCSLIVGAVLRKRKKVNLLWFLPVCVRGSECVCCVHMLMHSPCNSLHLKWILFCIFFVCVRYVEGRMTVSLTSILFHVTIIQVCVWLLSVHLPCSEMLSNSLCGNMWYFFGDNAAFAVCAVSDWQRYTVERMTVSLTSILFHVTIIQE